MHISRASFFRAILVLTAAYLFGGYGGRHDLFPFSVFQALKSRAVSTAPDPYTVDQAGRLASDDEKKAVARKIREFVANGGFMFAMCSATDTYDIALASENDDICDPVFDGDPTEVSAAQRLNQGTFDVYLADPREICPGGLGPPPLCRGSLHGEFNFYFERGRPAQPFP